MPQRFEYVAEQIESKDLTLKLNAVAKHGWRLVSLVQTHASSLIATFERELPDG